jgi:hypothetical protein
MLTFTARRLCRRARFGGDFDEQASSTVLLLLSIIIMAQTVRTTPTRSVDAACGTSQQRKLKTVCATALRGRSVTSMLNLALRTKHTGSHAMRPMLFATISHNTPSSRTQRA